MRWAVAAVALAVVLPQPAAAASRTLVSLRQTGGFAGVDRGLAVTGTGRVVPDDLELRTRQLSPARLQALREALKAARFGTLARHYAPAQPVADGFVYRIAYAGRTIRIDEHAVVPRRLARVFALLRALSPDLG